MAVAAHSTSRPPWGDVSAQLDREYPGLLPACVRAAQAGYTPDRLSGIYRQFVEPKQTGLIFDDGAHFSVPGVIV